MVIPKKSRTKHQERKFIPYEEFMALPQVERMSLIIRTDFEGIVDPREKFAVELLRDESKERLGDENYQAVEDLRREMWYVTFVSGSRENLEHYREIDPIQAEKDAKKFGNSLEKRLNEPRSGGSMSIMVGISTEKDEKDYDEMSPGQKVAYRRMEDYR